MSERRALSQIGGPVRVRGEDALASMLRRAWERAGREDPDASTHGFHSWPAKMHWAIARTVIEGSEAKTVLDPFCGGGTVLVEARVLGRRGIGVDLSPLAVRVADVRSAVWSADARDRFVASARAVAAANEARVRGRVPIRVDLPKREIGWYAPHVLKELGGLLEEIRGVEPFEDRRALAMVFSSIVVKVSKQRSDTDEREVKKRIRKGLATELFLRKARELSERWAAFAEVANGPSPKLIEGDARRLPRLLRTRRVGLIVSSPPYGGTYDYAAHHARRMAWLGLDDRALRRREIGARRRLGRDEAARRWDEEVGAMLGAMRAVLRDDGLVVLVMGDAQIGRRRVPVPAQLERLGPGHGLAVAAIASQRRRDWKGRHPREEHLVALRAEGEARSSS
ncbi:MAG TPA: DNA methyltransferase [Sandaracinaceae bacterium LLY-WYZ-13_1]|nr:DNA methyltransferase [Sandaracinaceae bacterium LLY-WYZ-13_1]